MNHNSDFEIIDFHTHPFARKETNICIHRDYFEMDADKTKSELMSIGISRICGSVIYITPKIKTFDDVKELNNEALFLREKYGNFYIPGFHVHPSFVKESCEEIERMHSLGVNLIGELVPYLQGWGDYSCAGLSEILELAEYYSMVVSFHSMGEDNMDKMVKEHPGVTFVAAHPGEMDSFEHHMNRMKMSDNYYLDVSGTGLFRHGMLRHGIELFGAERFILGSDYPICNPAMFIGGVRDEFLLSDKQKELILSGNAKRILNLK